MKLLQIAGDWWWPKLSSDGRFVAAGGGTNTVRMIDLASKSKADLGAGRAIHWFDDATMTWISEDGPLRDTRWICKPFGVPQRTADDPSLVAGNDFAASNRHWASWLAVGQRLVYDNKTIATGVRGVAMSGNFMLTATDTEFILYMGGVEARRFPLPARANAWTVNDSGMIGYGYYWPAWVLFFQDGVNLNLDVTVAAWEQEGVPIIVRGPSNVMWAWTHTVRPGDQVSLVVGRPIASRTFPGVTPCVVIENFPANTLDVIFVEEHFVLAGTDTVGSLQVHVVAYDEPRVPVIDIVPLPVPIPTPTPVPTPTPSPTPPPMSDYRNFVAEERAKYGTPLGIGNAWRICNAVALRITAETGDLNWGLHRKGGNNFDGYAVDIVAYKGGYMFDVLGDSEGDGNPQWSQSDPTTDWAPPVSAAPGPGPDPDPTPTPTPTGPDYTAQLAVLVAAVASLHDNVAAILGQMEVLNTTVAAKGDALVKAINDKQIKIGL